MCFLLRYRIFCGTDIFILVIWVINRVHSSSAQKKAEALAKMNISVLRCSALVGLRLASPGPMRASNRFAAELIDEALISDAYMLTCGSLVTALVTHDERARRVCVVLFRDDNIADLRR